METGSNPRRIPTFFVETKIMAAPLEYEVREEYQSYSLGQLLDAPVTCFQGVGEIQSELLLQYFNIDTVRQLAEMPSFIESLAVQETVLEGGEIINQSVAEAGQSRELAFHIRNSDQEKKISELPESPIHVLDGVTPGQDLALYDAFRITKVTQMAQNRIMLEARIIDYLSKEGNGEAADGGDGAVSSILGARAASGLAGAQRAMSGDFADARTLQAASEVSDHVRDRIDAMRPRQGTPPTRDGAIDAMGSTPDRLSSIRDSRGAPGARGTDMDRQAGGGGGRAGDIMTSRTPAGGGRGAATAIASQRGGGGRADDLAASRGGGNRAEAVLASRETMGRGGATAGGATAGGAHVRSRPSTTPAGAATTTSKAKPKQEKTLPTEEEVTTKPVVEPTPPPPPTNPIPMIAAGVIALLVIAGGLAYWLTRPEPQPVAVAPPVPPVTQAAATDNAATKQAEVSPPPEQPKGPVIQASRSVLKGDTLWRISIREYQDPLNWPSIFIENKDKIDNPDVIFPAQEFRIPANPEYRFPAFPKGYNRSR